MKKKIEALEATIAAMKITDSELSEWFNNRNYAKIQLQELSQRVTSAKLIPTELPLVYCRNNVLTIEEGLNLDRKNELWGIRLTSGVMIALDLGERKWYESKLFAQTMVFNGKCGSLPTIRVLKKHWGKEEKKKYENTAEVLRSNGVAVAQYRGCIWSNEEARYGYAYYFSLRFGYEDLGKTNKASECGRVGLFF